MEAKKHFRRGCIAYFKKRVQLLCIKYKLMFYGGYGQWICSGWFNKNPVTISLVELNGIRINHVIQDLQKSEQARLAEAVCELDDINTEAHEISEQDFNPIHHVGRFDGGWYLTLKKGKALETYKKNLEETMKEVIRYETADGKLFEDKKEAQLHEQMAVFKHKLRDHLIMQDWSEDTADVIVGEIETILRLARETGILDLMEENNGKL